VNGRLAEIYPHRGTAGGFDITLQCTGCLMLVRPPRYAAVQHFCATQHKPVDFADAQTILQRSKGMNDSWFLNSGDS
jgi:hypothetical protein